MARELELHRLAAQQHGLASRIQLLNLAFSRREIGGRVDRNEWRRIAPSVYEVAPGSLDRRRLLHAVVLSSGGWASHRSAGELLSLCDGAPAKPEIVVDEGRTPHALGQLAMVHRSRFNEPTMFTAVDGIACTSVERTLLDLSSVMWPASLEDAVGRALRQGGTTVDGLRDFVDRPMAGRRRARALRQAIDAYDDRHAPTQSMLEVLVQRAVREAGIPRPHRQFEVRLNGATYYLDLAWPEEKVFIEADGRAFHSNSRQFVNDRARQNALVVAGWLPLRYTWAVAAKQPAAIVSQLAYVLRARVAAA